MIKRVEPLYGTVLSKNNPPIVNNPTISIDGTRIIKNLDGTSQSKPMRLQLNNDILSRHLMLIGGTGCGKTNAFFHIVEQVKRSMTSDDVMIIFDTKGDYQKQFFEADRDCVISSSEDGFSNIVNWNIFEEIWVKGEDGKLPLYTKVKSEVEGNISEISWGLFSEAIDSNTSNPFFPNAARDLFASLLTYFVRYRYNKDVSYDEKVLNNYRLKYEMDTISVRELHDILETEVDQRAVINYIGDGKNAQGLGVLAEMHAVIRKIFVGAFCKEGNFSIKNFVKQRGGKTLFIEYDLSHGMTLTPVYKLLIDLALKEALSRNQKGNVYVFCDEFKLLPHLMHIEDAVNFGRGMGIKVFAGIQSINQLYETYGTDRGQNIIAGFSSVFSFRANDKCTREFTTGLFGQNYVLERYESSKDMNAEDKRSGNVVEDWDICNLEVGEAVIGLPNQAPFKFKFDLYRS